MTLRVVTWNIQAKPPAIVGMERLVAAWRPDVLLLQEANAADLEADPSLVASHPHRFMVRDGGRRATIAILSAYPVRDTGLLHVQGETSGRPRLLWADLQLSGGQRLVTASVHTSSPQSLIPLLYDPRQRNRQLAAISEYAQELLAWAPRLVIGGDFNTIHYAISGMTDAALALGLPAPTWRGLATRLVPPVLRLDRILVGPGLAVSEARVGTEYAGSDHSPVIAVVDDASRG